MSQITLATTPHPDAWLEHSRRPEMKGRRLGILAHTWFKPDQADQMGPIFKTITDIAVEEPTGLALDANVSLQDPLHNMMYEEWEDYDEFFTTQLTRPYRMAFLRWLIPVMAAPISAEFYEVIGQSGGFVSGANAGKGTVVLSAKVKDGAREDVCKLAVAYVEALDAHDRCKGAAAMLSLNDPDHVVVVERWLEAEDVSNDLTALPDRADYATAIADLGQAPTAETFRVHYNPGRFPMPP